MKDLGKLWKTRCEDTEVKGHHVAADGNRKDDPPLIGILFLKRKSSHKIGARHD